MQTRRRQRVCCICEEIIKPGEQHHFIGLSIVDRKGVTDYVHRACLIEVHQMEAEILKGKVLIIKKAQAGEPGAKRR